jgi:hypothetical protein
VIPVLSPDPGDHFRVGGELPSFNVIFDEPPNGINYRMDIKLTTSAPRRFVEWAEIAVHRRSVIAESSCWTGVPLSMNSISSKTGEGSWQMKVVPISLGS